MRATLFASLFAAALSGITAAHSIRSTASYSTCQSSGASLKGCPSGTKYVPEGASIQDAIDSGASHILIAPGDYPERLVVTKSLVLLGSLSGNVRVYQSAYNDLKAGGGANRDAATLYVKGGTFSAYNIQFFNTADDGNTASQPKGPAAAAYFERSVKASLYSCDLFSWQDTLYAGGAFFMWKG